MKPINPAGFESLFRNNVDPWNYSSSHFEAVKRNVLIHACGTGCRARVLELACANGETTKALAPRALRLLAVDSSLTATIEARQRTHAFSNVTICKAELPKEMPQGPFDLIVVSELLYYLPQRKLTVLLAEIAKATAPNGRIVLLHHMRIFPDASLPPKTAHAKAKHYFRRAFRNSISKRHGAYEVLVFDRKIGARV